MTVRSGDIPRTMLPRRSRRLVGITLALPAFLLAALLVSPGAATAGEVFGPDLTVSITDSPDPVSPGPAEVTFTVLVTNNGDDDSDIAQLEFSTGGDAVLDAQVTGGSGDECAWEGTSATCDLGFISSPFGSGGAPTPLLASNEAQAVIVVRAPDAPGTEFLSDAVVSSVGQTDQNPTDNTDSELTNVSEFDSASGIVPPGGSISTVTGTPNNPVSTEDPFAVALENISDQTFDVTIEEEPCDGNQEGDPLCSEPRLGGVAGDFMFQPVGGGLVRGAQQDAVVIAKLYYDRSLVQEVSGFVIYWQRKPDGPVVRLPRCSDRRTVNCFRPRRTEKRDQIVNARLSIDPRITRG